MIRSCGESTSAIARLRRGSSRDAAQLIRGIIADHDDKPRTAHDIAAETPDRDRRRPAADWFGTSRTTLPPLSDSWHRHRGE